MGDYDQNNSNSAYGHSNSGMEGVNPATNEKINVLATTTTGEISVGGSAGMTATKVNTDELEAKNMKVTTVTVQNTLTESIETTPTIRVSDKALYETAKSAAENADFSGQSTSQIEAHFASINSLVVAQIADMM